jgi:hypothetical protein
MTKSIMAQLPNQIIMEIIKQSTELKRQDEILALNKKHFKEVLETLTELRDYYLDIGCLNESNTHPSYESGVIQFKPKHSKTGYYPELDCIIIDSVNEYIQVE